MTSLRFLWLAALSLFAPASLLAQAGDTLVVQTFTFDDPSPVGWSAPYRGSFAFPDESESFSRILMAYTLKCDARTNHDNFACGEWDYLTYTFVFDSTGRWDSTFRTHPNFRVGFHTPDSIVLSQSPAYDLRLDAQPVAQVSDTLSTLLAQVGAGSIDADNLLGGASPRRRTQFLWTADELTVAGLQNRPLTALHLNLSQLGDELRHLRIGLKQVAGKDSLDADSPEATGFQIVYRHDNLWPNVGWQPLVFHQPFALDTTKSLVVEISYENPVPGSATHIRADATTQPMGAYTEGDDHYFEFAPNAYLEPSVLALADSIDSEVTLSFWHYGTSDLLPANTTAFEARDANNYRVLNAHVPWGDSKVYWDAGNSGSNQHDRVNKSADPNEFEGEWHHWAFSKNANTGRMEVYLDGVLWRGGFSRYRTMAGIARWVIGAGANGNNYFPGKIDEFRVWNRALDESTIREWMFRDVDNTHPFYANLIAHYSFDELSSDWTTPDESIHSGSATLRNSPRWLGHQPSELFRNWQTTTMRPQVIFDQSEYVFTLDTMLVLDSLPLAPVAVTIFGNDPQGLLIAEEATNHPRIPTDTLQGWSVADPMRTYDYLTGQVIDEQPVMADTVIYRADIQYHSPVVRYEIGRYITPYGINLDLGPEGKTWYFDVTDYAPLLRDNVYLQAGNNQELLDLKFFFIKGDPIRPVKSIRNIWDGSFSYQALFDDTQGASREFLLDTDASGFAVKTRSSGHGFGGPTNCAEFCPREHRLLVNGAQSFAWDLWNECADNFVYPQGGTWIYDRAGWCPGDVVNTYHHELTGLVTPGELLTLDYDVALPANTSPEGNYVLRAQLFEYGPHSHAVDVRLDEVLAPSLEDEHSRYNPVCDHPSIAVSNQGQDTVTSMLIRYGVEGGMTVCTYEWTGALAFGEGTVIDLPRTNWSGLDPENPVFFADIVYVNGGVDEVQENDLLLSPFELVPQYSMGTIIEFRTNNAAFENRYEIRDRDGQVVRSADGFAASTIYRDTLDLGPGCYTFHFYDSGEDGIAWWANNDGTGYVRLIGASGSLLRTFQPDYGKDIVHQFTVGYQLGQESPDVSCIDTNTVSILTPTPAFDASIYPNPAREQFFVDVQLPQRQDLTVRVFTSAGQLVSQEQRTSFRQGVLKMNTPISAGVYFVRIEAGRASRTMTLHVE